MVVICFLFFVFFFLAGFTEVVGLSPLIFATALGFFLRLRVEIIVTVIKKFIRAS